MADTKEPDLPVVFDTIIMSAIAAKMAIEAFSDPRELAVFEDLMTRVADINHKHTMGSNPFVTLMIGTIEAFKTGRAFDRDKYNALYEVSNDIMRHCNEATECPLCGISDGDHGPDMRCTSLMLALEAIDRKEG